MKTKRAASALCAAVMALSMAGVPAAAESVSTREPAAFSAVGGLAAPKFTGVTKGRHHIRFNWSKVSGASGYKIYRKFQGKFELIKTVKGGNVTSVRLGDFESRTRYTFKIRAYKKSGGKTTLSAYSPAKVATTKFGDVTDEFKCTAFSLKYEPEKWKVRRFYTDDEQPGSVLIQCDCLRSPKIRSQYALRAAVYSKKLSATEKEKGLKYIVDQFCEEEAPYHDYYDVKYGVFSGRKCAFLTEMDEDDDYPDRIFLCKGNRFYELTIDIGSFSEEADDYYDQAICLLNDVYFGNKK